MAKQFYEMTDAERKEVRKQRRKEKKETLRACKDLGIDPESQTGKWLLEGLIDMDLAELIAFKAYYRHKFTDYDQQFCDADFEHLFEQLGSAMDAAREHRENARRRKTELGIPNNWNHFLGRYKFNSELDDLKYETIRAAIEEWRQQQPKF